MLQAWPVGSGFGSVDRFQRRSSSSSPPPPNSVLTAEELAKANKQQAEGKIPFPQPSFNTTPPPRPLINTAQLEKLCRAKTCGYVNMMIGLEQHTEVVSCHQAQPEIETLLQEFADIFTSNKSLPPKREDDHHIPLKPNNKPPNVRPYRVPHK
jgi:hypothetical protein